VGSSEGHSKKLIPNPNVTLELGYAARSIGWDRIICVMNTAFGPPEELIFDLRHRRWPICYKLEGEGGEAIRNTRKLLEEQIQIALLSAMNSEHQAVEDASRRLSTPTIEFMEWHVDHDLFWWNHGDVTILQRAALSFIDHAVDRLLDLRLIDCFFDSNQKRFVYRWTYLGKLVLKKLDIRPRSQPNTANMVSNNPLKQVPERTPDSQGTPPKSRFQTLWDRFLHTFFHDKDPGF
jgi:hypothetical protein